MSDARAQTPALALDGITRRFGNQLALDDVSLHVRPGTVHALLGENGAGKTTLMRIAYGLLSPDAGRMHRAGRAYAPRSPRDAIAAGLGMVHQHFSHVARMTVAENVSLGGRGRYSRTRAAELVRASAQRAGLSIAPDARVEGLSVASQQRLEIVKALARNATLLILDEPTAVLAPAEASDLLAWIREFANAGNAAVLITHKLRDALSVADDVTVLRRGTRVLSSGRAAVDEDSLAAAMLGERVVGRSEPAPRMSDGGGKVVWSARDISAADRDGVERLHAATMEVRGGEIVGVVGVEGSGTRELLRVAAGRLRATRGTVAAATSVGFVPEDRHVDALVLEFTLTENVGLRGAGTARGFIDWRALRARTQELLRSGAVMPNDDSLPARALSGGNQQKLVFARERDGDPALIVAENPTRGLDIRASAVVHDALRGAAARGAGVLLYTSDLDEVVALATRLVAVHAGHVVEVPLDRDAAGRAMLGLSPT